MCQRCLAGMSASSRKFGKTDASRRGILAGAGAIAATAMASGLSLPGTARAQTTALPGPAGGVSTVGWGTRSATARLAPVRFNRRQLRDDDVQMEVLYAGICHSDIHNARGDWGPVTGLVVPGHEIIGRVTAVGRSVTKFRVGDPVGVGCLVDSCGECDACRRGLEQYCANGYTGTYGTAPNGEVMYGGYSKTMVLRESFAITIPAALDLRSAAPLLCAGITTFSPMEHWDVEAGQKVGLVGFGGLGHMGVKLFKARGADVTVFTTSSGKREDALRMGATEAVLWDDAASFQRLSGQFDFILSTVPVAFDVNPFVGLLKVDGKMVNVGVVGPFAEQVNNGPMIMGRKTLAGSLIGGIAETQAVIDYCAERNIAPEVEVISIDQVNQAWDRVVAKDVRYRFVIDMSTLAA